MSSHGTKLGSADHDMMQRLKYQRTTPLWQSAGIEKTRKVDGYETKAIAVFERHSARAVALVYAGFGDGVAVARLIAAAPALLDKFIELTKPEYGELANALAHEAIAYTQKAQFEDTKFDPDPPKAEPYHKRGKTRALRIHDLVVVGHEPESTVYRVVELDGKFRVGVIDAKGRALQATQWHDRSLFRSPSLAQIRRVAAAG